MYLKPYTPIDSPLFNAKANLHNKELWESFHKRTTEMIITKVGRRIFPILKVDLRNLDPNENYFVCLEMEPVSLHRHKFTAESGWTSCGVEETPYPGLYIHPESPSTGEQWMSQTVNFEKCKLTNCSNPPPGSLTLSSMHKYIPKIILVQTSNAASLHWSPSTSFTFPETEFIAVTAYQNNMITALKIDHNPFAKGFRENGKSKFKKRKIEQGARERLRLTENESPSSDSSYSSPPRSPNSERVESSIYHPVPLNAVKKTYPSLSSTYYDYSYEPHGYYPFISFMPSIYSSYPLIPYKFPSKPIETIKAPVELPVKMEKPARKITDFSIRRIMEEV